MSKLNESVKTVKSVNHDGPGRPRKEVKWPSGKFTRASVFARNGTKMTPLTVQKHLNWDMYAHIKDAKGNEKFAHVDKTKLRKNSLVVKLTETRAPKGESGLGRRQEVYALRSWLAENPDALTPKTAKGKGKTSKVLTAAKTSTVTVPVTDTPTATALEAQKEALGINAPATVPVVDVPPLAPEPIAETPAPAPEAVAAETANVATEATAPVAEPVTA